jgi:biopolymer transport protein TolR
MAGMINNRQSRGGGRQNFITEINVTPLVDVMLVLLIIFMITAPMLVSGVKVDLPDAETKALNADTEPLTLTMDALGKLYIMETEISIDELPEKLKAITKEKYDTRIFVRGDKVIAYGDVVSLIGKINKAGFTQVALVTTIKNNDKQSKK